MISYHTHFVETEKRQEDQRDKYKIFLRQKLQKWHEKFEKSEEVKSRCDSEDEEKV